MVRRLIEKSRKNSNGGKRDCVIGQANEGDRLCFNDFSLLQQVLTSYTFQFISVDEENNKQNLVRLSGEIQSIISFLTAVSSQPPRENNRSHCSLSMSSEDYSVALNKVTQQMEVSSI